MLQALATDDGFGELALLYHSPRACSVRAVVDGVLYALDRPAFHHSSWRTTGRPRASAWCDWSTAKTVKRARRGLPPSYFFISWPTLRWMMLCAAPPVPAPCRARSSGSGSPWPPRLSSRPARA